MGCKIKTDDILEFLKSGGEVLGTLALEIYGESLNQVGETAFSDAIEIGIENTIASLYEANVDDKEILRIVSEQWGIRLEDVEDRLVWEKSRSPIRSLKQYLKLQGFTTREIDQFMKTNRAAFKIHHNKELWGLRRIPQKLMKAVQEK